MHIEVVSKGKNQEITIKLPFNVSLGTSEFGQGTEEIGNWR
jgi:hypothetical protein